MDISPNDIRNYEFSNKMRGYDKEEVDSFLEKIAEALENAKQENLKLSMEIDSLKSQIAGLRQFEDTIKSAAIDARRNADLTIANAKKEAELIIANAKGEAEKLIHTQSQKISDFETKITNLELTKKSFISKIRNLINTHMDMIDDVAKADIKKNLTGEDIEVTESTDVTRKKLETIATKSKAEPIKTEEANAADKIVVADIVDTPSTKPSKEEKSEQKPGKGDVDKEISKKKAIDPELAFALENYQTQAAAKGNIEPTTAPKPETAPKPGEFVETTKRAEDVPDGFIAKDAETANKSSTTVDTDKVDVAPEAQDEPTEHNKINIEESNKETKTQKKVTPENIAEELDNVVDKFVEEIDKAEKN